MKKKETHTGALSIVRRDFPKVEKVYDADEVIIIDVQAQDNKGAVPFHRNKCPMARSTCRNIPGSTGAMIGPGSSYVIKGNTAYRYKNPETLTREVISWDRARIFEPGQYRLSPFPPCSRLGVHKSGPSGKRRKNHRTKMEMFRHITKNVRTMR